MALIPEYFRQRIEVETRPAFNADCEISIENFDGLVGLVRFIEDEQVTCQIRRPDGSRCGQIHWNGWVAVNKDGDEGYIGRDCADRHFKASDRYEEFANQKRTVRLAIQESQYLEILEGILSDDTFADRAGRVREQVKVVAQESNDIVSSLPRRVIERLQEIHKTFNNSVSVDYEYTERDEKGNVRTTLSRQRVGTFRGAAFVDFKTAAKPMTDISQLLSCLDEAKLGKASGKVKLKEWTETLGRLSELELTADGLLSRLKAFANLDNLKLLLLLAKNEQDRIRVARLLLRRKGKQNADIEDGIDYLEQFDESIRERNKGRDFRLV